MSKKLKSESKLIFTSNEWTFENLNKIDEAIQEIAFGEMKLDCYPNSLEVINSEQMLDAYASIGLPVMYSHWSFGKHFLQNEHAYRTGKMGLAYELVLNSNPCIAYLMEENSMTMQALVIAHASYGHNSFFKNNYLFKQWTDADSIIDYLIFAKRYIKQCEEKYGLGEVERILDSCHALMNHGVDRYKRPKKLNAAEEQARLINREEELRKQVNELWNILPNNKEEAAKKNKAWLKEPEENLLYFIEKNSPVLEPWQREIVRIVRKISQYFYPQRQTKVMNEGWATFVHYHIMYRLWEKGQISDGNMQEFLASHTGVVFQLEYDDKRYSGFNPYALGFAMMQDIKRICENPDDEDREWFPDLIGRDWLEVLKDIVVNYRDESFILQFLGPKIIRKWHIFLIEDKTSDPHYHIMRIHNDRGYKEIRKQLSKQYNIGYQEPEIQAIKVDFKGDRTLTLRHMVHDGVLLHEKSAEQVLKHASRLWGYNIKLTSVSATTGDEIGSLEIKKV